VNPAITDCEAPNCGLYFLNTREKRRKGTKTALRRAIRGECKLCIGRDNVPTCASAGCALYKFRTRQSENDLLR
jgi:hypothetical protein